MIEKVISGGQTGADVGFLLGAELCHVRTGGTAPRGYRTDEGLAPWLGSRFGLVEHESGTYPPRTRCNVVDSDGTIIFGYRYSPGCGLTVQLCTAARKPVLYVDQAWTAADVERFRAWAAAHRVKTLNGAGNRERTHPGIRDAASAFLCACLVK